MDDEELEYAKKLVGKTLKEKYRLDAVLGIGGMGVVYRGAHRNGKRVAVKTLHPHLSMRADVRTRFLREGYSANAVEHDGVVSVLDDDVTEDGTAFLVMELLVGETYDARAERAGNRLPPSEVLDAAYQLLDVLAAAHEKGIVHRDLKPENLFLTKGGVLKVLDFGIARVQHDLNMHMKTKTGTLLGTPAFMPPEQALGRVKEIDGRTDIWAAGATMFTLLSGTFVHAAENVDMLRIMAATKPARKLGAVAPQLPTPITEVVDRALAFEMKDRWQSAAEMQAAVIEAHRAAFGRPPASMKAPPSAAAVAAMAATEMSSEAPQSALMNEEPAEILPEANKTAPLPNAVAISANASPLRAKGISTTAGVSQSDDAPPAATRWSRKSLTLSIAGIGALLLVAWRVGFHRTDRPVESEVTATSGTPLVQSETTPLSSSAAPALPTALIPPTASGTPTTSSGLDLRAATKTSAKHSTPPQSIGAKSSASSAASASTSVAPTPSAATSPNCQWTNDLDSQGRKVNFRKVCQ